MEIGVRELKAKLSEQLERVERGEVITITSRGRRIAQIIPIAGSDNIEKGLREGWLHREVDAPPTTVIPQRPIPGSPTSEEILDELREE